MSVNFNVNPFYRAVQGNEVSKETAKKEDSKVKEELKKVKEEVAATTADSVNYLDNLNKRNPIKWQWIGTYSPEMPVVKKIAFVVGNALLTITGIVPAMNLVSLLKRITGISKPEFQVLQDKLVKALKRESQVQGIDLTFQKQKIGEKALDKKIAFDSNVKERDGAAKAAKKEFVNFVLARAGANATPKEIENYFKAAYGAIASHKGLANRLDLRATLKTELSQMFAKNLVRDFAKTVNLKNISLVQFGNLVEAYRNRHIDGRGVIKPYKEAKNEVLFLLNKGSLSKGNAFRDALEAQIKLDIETVQNSQAELKQRGAELDKENKKELTLLQKGLDNLKASDTVTFSLFALEVKEQDSSDSLLFNDGFSNKYVFDKKGQYVFKKASEESTYAEAVPILKKHIKELKGSIEDLKKLEKNLLKDKSDLAKDRDASVEDKNVNKKDLTAVTKALGALKTNLSKAENKLVECTKKEKEIATQTALYDTKMAALKRTGEEILEEEIQTRVSLLVAILGKNIGEVLDEGKECNIEPADLSEKAFKAAKKAAEEKAKVLIIDEAPEVEADAENNESESA